MKSRTNSVGHGSSGALWLSENISFLRMRLEGLKSKEKELTGLISEIDAYSGLYQKYTGRNLNDAKIFEIGYGARPLRLISLQSLGFDARGIDLDAPTLAVKVSDLISVLRTNGLLRFGKTFVRSILFDTHERRALSRVLNARGASLSVDPSGFLVGDASEVNLGKASLDFVYSEDVFEHIPTEGITAVCRRIALATNPNGLIAISPLVHTGLSGGHLAEWFPHRQGEIFKRKSAPWEHLRQRRFTAECYLNELRIQDYIRIFEEHFEILALENLHAGRGRSFLTDEIRAELSAYTEEELLSDKWRFVMKPKISS